MFHGPLPVVFFFLFFCSVRCWNPFALIVFLGTGTCNSSQLQVSRKILQPADAEAPGFIQEKLLLLFCYLGLEKVSQYHVICFRWDSFCLAKSEPYWSWFSFSWRLLRNSYSGDCEQPEERKSRGQLNPAIASWIANKSRSILIRKRFNFTVGPECGTEGSSK